MGILLVAKKKMETSNASERFLKRRRIPYSSVGILDIRERSAK
jgi:hypothetical protein